MSGKRRQRSANAAYRWEQQRNLGACASLGLTRSALWLATISFVASSCLGEQSKAPQAATTTLGITNTPIATITAIGSDTLSDSARVYQLEPEPDAGSVAFLFADPSKGITRGLGIVQASGNQTVQLGWPDSVLSVWWSNQHQLSFTAGTGQGVRVVVDVHAAQLQALEATQGRIAPPVAGPERPNEKSMGDALSRAQAFIDSVRVQPEGQPQQSALRYRADSILLAPNDTMAAIHVSAEDSQGNKVNPAWYLMHLPSGHVQGIDSLTGRSLGLPASAGRWGAEGSFYYTKERSIWKTQPTVK